MSRPLRGLCTAVLALFGCALTAQLNGVFTCANGNPGNAFDYGDIGQFFNALETQGMNGPVTLHVFDDGGPFSSTASYCLGYRSQVGSSGIVGLGAANPLTIRAAAGEQPVISGSGAPNPTGNSQTGTLGFWEVEYLTIEGLTIRDGVDWGIFAHGKVLPLGPVNPLSNLRIASCRIHDILNGLAIFLGFDDQSVTSASQGFDFVIIENNFIWNCARSTAPGPVAPVVSGVVGLEWIVRHNTILHLDAVRPLSVTTLDLGGNVGVEQFHSNIIYTASTVTSPGPPYNILLQPPPIFADFNVYFLGGTAEFGGGYWTSPGPPPPFGWPAWQAAGYDLNGIIADPLLVNITQGQEDLHLQPGSPAIDRSNINAVPIDIDGDARPQGVRRESGADEYIPPDMVIEFGAAPVAHQGAVNIGGVPLGGAGRTFTIRNTSGGTLQLTGTPRVVLALGGNCDPAMTVQSQPPLASLPPAATASFTVFVDPVAIGALGFTISIASNVAGKDPYVFTVTASGLPPNQPARADPAAGSTFAGAQNGPFQCPMQPGTALNNASIDLTDPDADAITILSITPPATALTGVIPPGVGLPVHPRALTWTGTISPAAAPGSYTWTIQFRDAVNQSIITISATIQVANLPPTHLIAGAQGGDGSAANPYQCGFNRGDDGSASVGLCTVTDPNTGQMPFISQTIKAGTNPGTVNFAFALNAGLLNVAPTAMLTVAEAGQHDYEVRVSDGTNLVGIFVVIVVANPPMNFTTASQLPAGETGTAYTAGLAVTGAIGAVTFTVATGQLPDGLALDAGTGQISGTPTQAEAANFTVEAEDATGATTTRAFQLEVTNPPPPPGPNPRAEGSDGCVAVDGGASVLLLALLPALARRKKEKVKR